MQEIVLIDVLLYCPGVAGLPQTEYPWEPTAEETTYANILRELAFELMVNCRSFQQYRPESNSQG